MSKKQPHWTESSRKNFLYSIATDFVEQIQTRLKEKGWNQTKLARAAGLDKSRISQLLNNPGNLELDSIIRLVRAVDLKVAIVAYNDNDETNTRGPINAEVFRLCWEKLGKPADMWDYRDMTTQATIGAGSGKYKNVVIYDYNPLNYVSSIGAGYLGQANFGCFQLDLRSVVSHEKYLIPQ